MMQGSKAVWLAGAVMAALWALAWTPGGEYAAGSGARTNTVYDPLTGGLYPWQPQVQVMGVVTTNDVAVFADRSGRYVRGTNLVVAVTNEAALRAAGDAGLTNLVVEATNALPRLVAIETNGVMRLFLVTGE